jgi:hypothetical protein
MTYYASLLWKYAYIIIKTSIGSPVEIVFYASFNLLISKTWQFHFQLFRVVLLFYK